MWRLTPFRQMGTEVGRGPSYFPSQGGDVPSRSQPDEPSAASRPDPGLARHIVPRSVTSNSWIRKLSAQWRRELELAAQYPQERSGASLRK